MRACPAGSRGLAVRISEYLTPPVAQPLSAMHASIAPIVLMYICPPRAIARRRRPDQAGRRGFSSRGPRQAGVKGIHAVDEEVGKCRLTYYPRNREVRHRWG